MKKLSVVLLLYLGLASAALAQVVSWPPPAGTVAFLCVYNTSPPTLSTTNVGFVQCDSTGKLIVSGGGGGGGAVTIADGADVTQGAIADAASSAGGTGTLSAKLRLMTTQLGTINTTLGSPFQAGGALAANQSVNISQINAVTPLMGNGGTGTGSQRVTIASDNTAFTVNAAQATAASLNATVVGTGTFVVQNTTAAGENHIGEVGGNILPITNTMTTANATTATGQSIGGLQTIANAVRVSGSLGSSGTSGIIQSTMVTFKDAVGAGPLDVYYFNANPSGSTCTNNNAFILVDADRDKVVGISHVTDFTASNTAAIAQAQNQAIPFGVSSATSIFACVVARANFAITSTANASLIARILRN